MIWPLVIVDGVLILILLFVAEMRPPQSTLSVAELKRRVRGDHSYRQQLQREELRADILSWLRVKDDLLLLAITVVSIVALGWLWGIIVSLLVIGFYGTLARLIARRPMRRLYLIAEPRLLAIIRKVPFAFRLIRSSVEATHLQIGSREELVQLIEEAGEILSPEERRIVIGGLGLNKRTVSETMTPRAKVRTVPKGELLGPLVLDELHRQGHGRLPVVASDIDHIVGILHLDRLFALEEKRSVTAASSMDRRVVYIPQEHTLEQALTVMTRSHQHILIAVDGDEKTTGLITLNDILEVLFGRSLGEAGDN